MRVCSATLHHICMRLKTPFVNSLTTVEERNLILVELEDELGTKGWGECVAFSSPWYTEETITTAWHVMTNFLLPLLQGVTITSVWEVSKLFAPVRRNPMAKAGIEGAVWDLFARRQGVALSSLMGGKPGEVKAGATVGLKASLAQIVEEVSYLHHDQGYERVKVKIKPGRDVDLIHCLRQRFPQLMLIADANSAYTLADLDHLRLLEPYKLTMIEQPLAADDIVDHATLAKQLRIPICLDESITSAEDARRALELGSCQVMSIKIGRVGGIAEAIRIHNLCARHKVPVWVGGMLESGVSRAQHLALATLPNFTIPGDLSASTRYWEQDVTKPEVKVSQGKIRVPSGTGIGFHIDEERLRAVTVRSLKRQL
ncbi:o-succinylbenzoate synthase [Mechercharimyces sp. CAU 1602]|uniref:o-succinylbenzoate synthase n=1 Tax=Mechercharimyces sp. CAU 1602 TaxID=2973933 RepID=UPI002162E535|nr:o-succinylbenzoate synthase [Mechercharimyces sp. CAU 1602]MCS1351574.1 o-succinylbenzoate synthase [Mechercharimyces sp. CAU 1602]